MPDTGPLLNQQRIRLRNAILLEDEMLCRDLISRIDPNMVDADGQSFLHIAVGTGKVVICQILLEAGCNPNLKNNRRRTALHDAVEAEEHAIVELLLAAKNIDINIQDPAGWTPAFLAASKRDACALNMLLTHKEIKLTLKDASENTLLDYTVYFQEEKIWSTLISAIDINSTDSSQNTALHHALYAHNVDLGKKLLECKEVSINHQNNQGKTPLMLAVKIHAWDLVEILIDKGADLALQDNGGKTAKEYTHPANVPPRIQSKLLMGIFLPQRENTESSPAKKTRFSFWNSAARAPSPTDLSSSGSSYSLSPRSDCK